jgi:ABC-type uncharacterized transport system ATPase subunit
LRYIIREGTLVEVATIHQLKSRAMKEIKVEFATKEALKKFSDQLQLQTVESVIFNETHASFMITREQLSNVIDLLSKFEIFDIEITSPALEDIFLKYYEVVS